jgi:hypothetical protein
MSRALEPKVPGARRRSIWAGGLALAVTLLFASTASAMTASSTFDSDDEGWTWTQEYDPTSGSTLEPVTWMSGDGGFIRALDTTDPNVEDENYRGAFVSPQGVDSQWSGDASDNYGGTLSFDIRMNTSDGAFPPLVGLFSGEYGTATAVMGFYDESRPPPGTEFSNFSITLLESNFLDGSTAEPPSEADFREFLANLGGVYLNTEASPEAGETNDLDNVLLTEPADTDGDGVPDFEDECPNQDGPASNGGCPATNPPGGDTTPPDTTITKVKVNSKKKKAKFEFVSSEPAGAEYLCKLDKGNFTSCTSPKKYKKLKKGKHTFQVASRDAAGNLDPSPAVENFKIKKKKKKKN